MHQNLTMYDIVPHTVFVPMPYTSIVPALAQVAVIVLSFVLGTLHGWQLKKENRVIGLKDSPEQQYTGQEASLVEDGQGSMDDQNEGRIHNPATTLLTQPDGHKKAKKKAKGSGVSELRMGLDGFVDNPVAVPTYGEGQGCCDEEQPHGPPPDWQPDDSYAVIHDPPSAEEAAAQPPLPSHTLLASLSARARSTQMLRSLTKARDKM